MVYENTTYAISRIQLSAMTSATSPAPYTTTSIGIEAASAAGQPAKILLSLSVTKQGVTLGNVDLAHLPEGISFAVSRPPAEPYYPVWRPADDVFEGYARLEPTSAFPGYNVQLCLTARLKAYEDIEAKTEHTVSLKIWATEAAKLTPCASQHDYLCNDYMGAALVGTCDEDGTCTCLAGHAKSPSTGRCMY